MDVAVPLEWTYMMAPDGIEALMPGERGTMHITLTPGTSSEGVSEYDIRLFAEAVAGHGEKIRGHGGGHRRSPGTQSCHMDQCSHHHCDAVPGRGPGLLSR